VIGDLFIYNLLKAILLVTLLVVGYSISTTKKNVFIYIFLAVIAFSLIEGLRWDRGPDYYNNYLMLTSNNSGLTKSEPVFNFIISILRDYLSIPFWGSFIVFSFLYIYSYTKAVMEFPKTALWALPIMFITTVDAHENLVRQFIGISFVLFAYTAYIRKKSIISVLCIICAVNIHYSGAIIVAAFIFIKFFKPGNIIKSPIYLLAIYLILYFFWDVAYLNQFTSFFESIDSGVDSMQGYLDNAERWFSDEGSLSKLHNTSGIVSIANMFFDLLVNSVVIYYGYYAIKKDNRLDIPYWFTYTAIIIFTIGGDVEIYGRFAWWFYCFMPIVLGSIWYLVPMNRKIRTFLICTIIFSYIYPFIMNMLTTIPYSGFAFVWDL